MRQFLFILFFLSTVPAVSQELLSPRSQGMGGLNAIFSGQDAIWANPAGLVQMDEWGMSTVFERRFLLADLNHIGIGGAFSSKSSHFGMTVHQFGSEEFKRQTFGLKYARALHQRLSLGAAVNYLQTRIDEYGNEAAIGFEIGLQSMITEQLLIGTHLVNPIPASYSEDEDLPSIFRFGAAYIPSSNVTVGLELEKDVDFPLRIRTGFEYQASSSLKIRIGYSSEPSQIHFGIGVKIGKMIFVNSALRYHATLGFTPTFGLTYEPKNG